MVEEGKYKRVELNEIFVSGQIGTSFRAVVGQPSRGERLARLADFVAVDPKVEDLKPGTYFIKCPDNKLSAEGSRDFVDREYRNGSAINHVADRALKRDSSISINRMIGRAKLHDARWSDVGQECLIYEYAGDSSKENITLATQWSAKFSADATRFLAFAESLAQVIKVLHNQGIVHTYLVPRNIICHLHGDSKKLSRLEGKFTLVGFGYARYADEAGRRLLAGSREDSWPKPGEDNWFRAPECRREHTHAAFGYPADIYSIGAILYFLLLGNNSAAQTTRAMEVLRDPPTDVRLLKTLVSRHLMREQVKVLQSNENILKIIDTCLRYDAESRFTCVEELIEAIEIAQMSGEVKRNRNSWIQGEGPAVAEQSSHARSEKDAEAEFASKIAVGPGVPVLGNYYDDLKHSLASDLAQRYAGLARGHFEVYGHRDRIITSLCRLLGSARKGDRYRTMTLPDYWTDTNLGSLGRFLTMNKHMARMDVKIERLFLVSDLFHSLPEEEQAVLEAQYEALRDLQESSPAKARNLVLKVLPVPVDMIADFERNGELVAYLESLSGARGGNVERDTVCLNFFSTARESWSNGRVLVRRTIKKARYWNPEKASRTPQFNRSREQFEKYLDTAQLLGEFIRQGQTAEPGTVKLARLLGKVTSAQPSHHTHHL